MSLQLVGSSEGAPVSYAFSQWARESMNSWLRCYRRSAWISSGEVVCAYNILGRSFTIDAIRYTSDPQGVVALQYGDLPSSSTWRLTLVLNMN